MEIYTSNITETHQFADKIANLINKGELENIICLYGELGSGKTTFVQGLGNSLGINQVLPSPTFVIQREYDLNKGRFKKFYHLDLYRIEKEQEFEDLGLKDIFLDNSALIAIEWADRLTNKPKDRVDIRFEYVDETRRKIVIDNLLYATK